MKPKNYGVGTQNLYPTPEYIITQDKLRYLELRVLNITRFFVLFSSKYGTPISKLATRSDSSAVVFNNNLTYNTPGAAASRRKHK